MRSEAYVLGLYKGINSYEDCHSHLVSFIDLSYVKVNILLHYFSLQGERNKPAITWEQFDLEELCSF